MVVELSKSGIDRFMLTARQRAYEVARNSFLDAAEAEANRMHGTKSPGFYITTEDYNRAWSRCFLAEMERCWKKDGQYRESIILQDFLAKHHREYRRYRKAQLQEELAALHQLEYASNDETAQSPKVRWLRELQPLSL